MLLSLNCLVLGQGTDRMFTVKIEKTRDVSILKDLIKEKRPNYLKRVSASDVDLWKVNFPADDLEVEPANFELDPDLKLLPATKLLSIFKDGIEDDYIHVMVVPEVVQTVAAPYATQILYLNCIFVGDDPNRMFTVKIEKTKNISMLKKLIKKDNANNLKYVFASDLDLWKVNFPVVDYPSNLPTDAPELRSENLLSDVFPPGLDPYSIHVMAYTPKRESRVIGKSKEERDWIGYNFYKWKIGRDLNKHLNRLLCGPSPSDTVHSALNLRALLGGYDPLVHLGGVPATIFNPAIAMLQRRLDNLEGVQVVLADIERAAKYLTSATVSYRDEHYFRYAIQDIVDEAIGDKGAWGVALNWADKITPGGAWQHDGFLILVLEPRATLGLSGDAIFKSIVDYKKIISQKKYRRFREFCNFPIVLVGATANRLEISVAVCIGHIYVTRLLTLEPCLGVHASNNIIRLARVFKALSLCHVDLKNYYDAVSQSPSPRLSSLFPSPTPVNPSILLPQLTYRHFMSRVGHPISAIVDLGESTSVLYTAILSDTNEEVIVKFTARYNAEAHRLLAGAQLAPKLHFCERVVGDLYMVVMDRVNGKSVWQLRDDQEPVPAIVLKKVKEAVYLLHAQDIVFGDLRDSNILYIEPKDPSDENRVVLVDFDWAGKDGESRYPASLNIDNDWAEEVAPFGIMYKAHDIWQLDQLIPLCEPGA